MAHLEFLRDVALPARARTTLHAARCCCRRTASGAERTPAAPRTTLFGYRELAARRSTGDWRACKIRRDGKPSGGREGAAARPCASDRQAAHEYGDAWDEVAKAPTVQSQTISSDYDLLEAGSAFNTELFGIARTLVRLAEETAKPNAERLREYRESALDSLEQQLFSEAPIYADLETRQAGRLAQLICTKLARPTIRCVKKVLGRQVAARAAARADRRHEAGRRRRRKQLAEGGQGGRRSLDDPMIVLVRKLDPTPRARPQEVRRRRSRASQRQAYAQDRQGPLRARRRRHLSRRHVHAAAGLRHGEGLRGRRQARCPS